MSTKKLPSNIRLELTDIEWEMLSVIAKKKGKRHVQRLINVEVRKFYERWKDIRQCRSVINKRVKGYEIPEEMQEFYNNLATRFDRSLTSTVFRFVILPLFSSCSDFDVMKKLPKKTKR